MPQGPIASVVAKSLTNVQVPLLVDKQGALQASGGGLSSSLNITAAKVVKATPGRIARVVVSAPGTTSGALTLNDCATTGAAAAANQILSIPFGSMTSGQVINLDFPCAVGIVVSAVPGAGSPIYAISYT
jgi:hypothetical protein